MSSPKVFVVRADFGRHTEAFRDNGYAGIGWFTQDPSGIDTGNKELLKRLYKKEYPKDAFMRMNQNVGQIFRFVNEIREGDVVISPFDNGTLLIGRIESDLYFESDKTSPYPWRKKVKWLSKVIDRHEFSVPVQNTLRSSLTCFRIEAADEILAKMGMTTPTLPADSELPSNSPSTYDLIKKRFLELDATEFELLVSYVLRSLGFEPNQETGKVGDGGIDFEGVLDVFGVASINLQVQVKRYDKGAIGEKEIRNFRGALKKGFQGCFITLSRFNKKATESATDEDREPIQLIDGVRFIEIFIEQHDKIMEAIYEDDLDEFAGKLKFKKALIPI